VLTTRDVCAVAQCERQRVSTKRSHCKAHDWRLVNHGDVQAHKPIRSKGTLPAFIATAVASETDTCIIWPYSTAGKGYPVFNVAGRNVYVHRHVLALATGNEPEGKEAAHAPVICHTPACINPRHLRWATRSENHRDKVLDGTDSRGENSATAKLTFKQVLAIRRDPRIGREIATDYRVSVATICNIVNHKTWLTADTSPGDVE